MIPISLLADDEFNVDAMEIYRTYKLTDESIKGYVDEIESLKQAIYKVLNTEKYEYPIYSFSYGIDVETLIGRDKEYVTVELKRRIRECLIEDERIESIENFVISAEGDTLVCMFQVVSIYGGFTMSKEVNV